MRAHQLATVGNAVDGDSVWLQPDSGAPFVARIGGVDVPSSGPRARAAKRILASWHGRRVRFSETCCGRPHRETPGVITSVATGQNLGRVLLQAGVADRVPQFPISVRVPNLSSLV